MTIEQDVHGQTVTSRLHAAKRKTRDISELIGICRGVTFDEVVSQPEAERLFTWLHQQPELVQHWPGNVIYQRLSDALEDGHLDQQEAADMLKLLLDVVGQAQRVESVDTETGEVLAEPASTSLPIEDVDCITFEGAFFVLTGKFVTGSRKECEQAIEALGGSCQSNPTKKTGYVVVGEVGSRDWAHTSAGRKLQKAIAMQEAGHDIKIISEQCWASLLT